MHTKGHIEHEIPAIQFQVMLQSISEVLSYSILAANAATTCLSETKAMLDQQTFSWIKSNMLGQMKAEKRAMA